MVDVFTSITLNYLPKAKLLASSLKENHPTWKFHLLVCDLPDDGTKDEFERSLDVTKFDKVHWITDLDIPNVEGWIFKHKVVEICTAAKGPFTKKLLDEGSEKVIYLDPDIAVFNSLSPIEELLDEYAILLTPHMLIPESTDQAIRDNEIAGTLKHGVFNFGFYAVNGSPEGKRFGDWWSNRLENYCYDDIPNGLFTDQKWGDLIPCFFEKYHILRDPGCNVASWNLSHRKASFSDDGTLQVNGHPLRFYHFTGYDSGAGQTMTSIYADGNTIIEEIWAWYGIQLQEMGQDAWGKKKWSYNYFECGDTITQAARLLYRQRKDLQEAFPNPYSENKKGGYWAWYNAQKAK